MTPLEGRDLLERGVRACEDRGYAVVRPESGRDPPALAEPTAGTTAFGTDRPVAVEPLRADEVTPTTLVSRLWDDVERGREALFVVPAGSVDDALDVLEDPPFLADRSPEGHRTFYVGPDRVPLAGGGYALARPAGDYRWVEESAADVERVDGPADGDATRLVLRAGGGPVAVLPDTAALDCPPADRFPFSYARGDEGRIHVRSHAGDTVHAADGVRALGREGFVPVPMPLVPEHVFDDPARAAEAWTLLGVED
jgi:hypothetical protein